MIRARTLAFLGSLIVLVGRTAPSAVFEGLPPDPGQPMIRHVRYSFLVRNETNRVVRGAEFRAYAPVKQTSTQRCLRIETSHPCELTADELGNQLLHFALEELPPRGTRRIWVAADVGFYRSPRPVAEEDLSRFLAPEPHIQSTHPEIVALAESLKEGTVGASPGNILRWVSGNLRYAGYLREDRGALFALKSRTGDCTEYSSLFVALCRATGVPARAVVGYVCSDNALLKASEFHQWAEFWAEGTWSLADPLRKGFPEAEQQAYLATRVVAAGANVAPGQHRFWVSPEGVSARME